MMKNVVTLIFILVSCSLFSQEGTASYYANKFEGRKTSSGEIFSQKKLTAAHKNLPFGTLLRVTNLSNDSVVVVKVNDRLPQSSTRMIDLSYAAAEQLNFIRKGLTKVKLEHVKEYNGEYYAANDYLYYKGDVVTLSSGVVDTVTVLKERNLLLKLDTTIVTKNLNKYYQDLAWNHYTYYLNLEHLDSPRAKEELSMAISLYHRSLSIVEDYSALHNLATCLSIANRCDEAEEIFKRALLLVNTDEERAEMERALLLCRGQK
jgi:rare lipoprotein A